MSREDSIDSESGSIKNQRDFLTSFVNSREDLELSAEFSDDGYGGYSFDRPQFQAMLEAVKKKKIDCICVKDLSRLGRNFLKNEEYQQLIFPKLGVRFIAVGNDIDSAREKTFNERISQPIINLANEMFVAETSQKIRRSQEICRRKGDFIGSYAVYGYIKNGKKLKVDEEAATIVKEIFSEKINGANNQSIANDLNKKGVLCPLEYKLSKQITVAVNFKQHEKAKWQSSSIKRVLENEIYTGTLVQGKTTTASYKDKRRFVKEKSDWICCENNHEPIISEITFRIVQDLLSRDTYTKLGDNCKYKKDEKIAKVISETNVNELKGDVKNG